MNDRTYSVQIKLRCDFCRASLRPPCLFSKFTQNLFVVDSRKPKIPGTEKDWPLYSKANPEIVYMAPNNFTVVRGPKSDKCGLWEPYIVSGWVSNSSWRTKLLWDSAHTTVERFCRSRVRWRNWTERETQFCTNRSMQARNNCTIRANQMPLIWRRLTRP